MSKKHEETHLGRRGIVLRRLVHESGSSYYGAVTTCRSCGVVATKPVANKFNPDYAERAFSRRGWTDKNDDGMICPQCSKPTKLKEPRKEEIIPPSAKQVFAITTLLQQHFVDGSYKEDMTDEKIANACDVPIEMVISVRDEVFGAIRSSDPRVRELHDQVETLAQAVEALQSVYTDEMAQIESKLKKLQELVVEV